MRGLLAAQEKIVDLLLSKVLEVPHVFAGAMPYGDGSAATRYPYLAAKVVTGSMQMHGVRTGVVRAIYGLNEKHALETPGDGELVEYAEQDTPEQMGAYLVMLAESAQGAMEELAGNLKVARCAGVSWSVEQRITRPYWHLLLDFDIVLPSRPAHTHGFLT